MKQSCLNTYEALLKQCLMVPELVTKSAKKDNSFLADLDVWLIETENIMETHNISRCSEIAGLRSKIVAASYSVAPKISKRKYLLSVSTSILYDAQRTLLEVLQPIEKHIEESREAIRQLLAVAYQANMINMSLDFTQMIQQLWSSFLLHEQLKGIAVRILVQVNQSDALRLLAEEIDMSILQPNEGSAISSDVAMHTN